MFSRTKILIGEDINKLHKLSIIVFGIGGVGGYACEMLARAGVGNITLVDYDKVDVTNKNRQIIALDSTIGKYKVDVMKDRILSFNSNCNVTIVKEKLIPDNIETFNLEKYDYIVDAIDMITSKVALIDYAHKHNIPIISAMGAGNRIGIPNYKVADIYDTFNDGLSKVLRKLLRERGIKKHKVVFCDNTTIDNHTGIIGSISYYPATCGCILASAVIDDVLKGE